MSRPSSNRLIRGSVSAAAVIAVLTACSQPASYATVDLSSSYGGMSQTAQAYNMTTGQPLYQSVSLYGPQSVPNGTYAPTSQLAYLDAPTNQVASLGNDTYGILSQPSRPLYSTPSFNEAELLSSPEFYQEVQSVNQPYVNVGSLDSPAPLPMPSPAPVEPVAVEVAPVSVEEVLDTAFAAPRYQPLKTSPAPLRPSIEVAELAPLPERSPLAARPQVAQDYSTLSDAGAAALPAPADDLWIAPQFGSQQQTDFPPAPIAQSPVMPRAPQQQRMAALPREPQQKQGSADAYLRNAADLLRPWPSQEVAFPSPNAVPDMPNVEIGGGVSMPKPSGEYARPYEALRPGIWPEIALPGEGLVEAPSVVPQPLIAEAITTPLAPFFVAERPSENIERASERDRGVYTIARGDTLLSIAQQMGMEPETLAFENGLRPQSQIYIGQKLSVAKRPPVMPLDVTFTDTALPMFEGAYNIDKNEQFLNSQEREFLPMLDFGIVESAMVLAPIDTVPIQRASVAFRDEPIQSPVKRFSWPVHGDVYWLNSGQVEIDARDNADVTASAAGHVAHVEDGAQGVLVVIEHDNGWRSLTLGLEQVNVSLGDYVGQGAPIGVASPRHRVRFELRDVNAQVADALQQLRG